MGVIWEKKKDHDDLQRLGTDCSDPVFCDSDKLWSMSKPFYHHIYTITCVIRGLQLAVKKCIKYYKMITIVIVLTCMSTFVNFEIL